MVVAGTLHMLGFVYHPVATEVITQSLSVPTGLIGSAGHGIGLKVEGKRCVTQSSWSSNS
eukprot:2346654-Pyramimonas_sp.AAC.1